MAPTTAVAAEKVPRRGNGRSKANTKPTTGSAVSTAPQTSNVTDEPTQDASTAAASAMPTRGGSYVRRLDLTGRCSGATPLTRAPIDLTNVLSDADALRDMSEDLLRPFRPVGVDMVVAVHEESDATHSFTAAIAGAMAGRLNAALGQVAVHRARPSQAVEPPLPPSPRPRAKKRGRPPANKTKKPAAVETDAISGDLLSSATSPPVDCQRIARFQHEATGLSVEYRRELLPPRSVGTRVLLVSDWIDSLDALVAARDALAEVGADVIGISFVVATSSSLLEELAKLEIVFSYSWTPTPGAQLTVRGANATDGVRCQCEPTSSTNPPSPSKRLKIESVLSVPELQYYTSHYEANSPSEDRSVNASKPSDPGVRLFAVLDGHGGHLAVDHLKKTLCHEIFAHVTSKSSPEEVERALTQAFLACDDMLKKYLESLPPDSMLYVANVGDCGAVIGRRDPITDRVWARELSTEHNCRNSNEVKLVMERSRDRNAIRLSKDDQENENVYGVRRVAGSLAVTRAFGDFYLKCEELSSAPFKSKVPYITVEPSVCKYDLSENDNTDQTLILASDGLWEVVGCEEAVKIVTQFDPQQSFLFPSCSAALVHVALEKVAHRDGMMLHELMALPRGRERRRFHDDVTCTVISIKPSRPRLSSVETLEEIDPTGITDEEQSQS